MNGIAAIAAAATDLYRSFSAAVPGLPRKYGKGRRAPRQGGNRQATAQRPASKLNKE
jgi:hypothetical protein